MYTQLKQVPPIAVISRTDRITIPQIPAHSGPAIQSLFDALARLGAEPVSSDILYIYHNFDGDPATPFDLEICLPVHPNLEGQLSPPFRLGVTQAFQCLGTEYTGPMTTLPDAWANLIQSLKAAGHEPTGESREIYKKWIDFDSADNVTELQQGVE